MSADLYVLLVSFLLFYFLTLEQPWPSPRRGDPVKVYRRFGPRLKLKNSIGHFAHLPLIIAVSKSAKFCIDFRHQSRLTRSAVSSSSFYSSSSSSSSSSFIMPLRQRSYVIFHIKICITHCWDINKSHRRTEAVTFYVHPVFYTRYALYTLTSELENL